MYSSRRYNVERHIETLHPEVGNVITFMEYLSGVRTGNYIHKSPPSYKKSNTPSKIFVEEFYRELGRQYANKATKTPNNPYVSNLLKSLD